MKKVSRAAVIMVVVFFIGLFLFSCGVWRMESGPHSYYYSGKILFNTTEEFSEFQSALMKKEVKLVDVIVVGQTPPVLVDFDLEARGSFLYGDRGARVVERRSLFLLVLGGVTMIAGVVIGWKARG